MIFTLFSYWTPSRCAKILIDKDVRDLPADSFIFVKVWYFYTIKFYPKSIVKKNIFITVYMTTKIDKCPQLRTQSNRFNKTCMNTLFQVPADFLLFAWSVTNM